MTFQQWLERTKRELNQHTLAYNRSADELAEIGKQPDRDPERVAQLRSQKDAASIVISRLESQIAMIEREMADDERATRAAEASYPAAPAPVGGSMSAGGSRQERDVRAGDLVDLQTRERVSLRPGESVREHPVFQRMAARSNDAATIAQYGDIGQLVRAITTTGGSAIVPTQWAGDLIDRARNKAAVLQAGATIVPMDAQTVKVGRLTGDPTAAFRAEGSLIAASDITLDNITLTAKTQSALVIGSLEWFQDADNSEEIVGNAIANAIALNLDLAALYGSITSGAGSINLPTPPNPRGLLGTLAANLPGNILGAATNGTAQTAGAFYNELIDVVLKVKAGNETPNAMIYNARLAQLYAKAYDSTGQPLRAPAEIEDLQRIISNQIPSYTQGTMTGAATDVFTGDWSKLLIGQRLDITLQTLTERYADTGQIGIVAHMRGDIAIARESAFAVYRALKGA